MATYEVEIKNISIGFGIEKGTTEIVEVLSGDGYDAVRKAVNMLFGGEFSIRTDQKNSDGSAYYELTGKGDPAPIHGKFYAYSARQ
jgi:hypothetical protein